MKSMKGLLTYRIIINQMRCNFFKSWFILFILCALIVINGNSQQVKQRFYVQLSGGASIPVGKFAKKILSYHPDSSYGLAKPGPVLSVKAGYQLNKRFSLSLRVSGMLNREDKKPFESDGYNTPDARSSITVHNWKTLSILLGPDYFLDPGRKERGLIFIPSIHAGIVKTGFPGDSAVYFSGEPGSLNYSASATWRDKFPLRWAFAYQVSADILYPLSRRLFIDAGLDFFNSVNLRSAKNDSDPRRFKLSTINIQAGVRMLL